MIVSPVVNNAPYPFTATATSNGGKLLVQFSGSAWRGTPGKVSVDLLMDGAVVATASVYTNEASSHKALVPVAVLIPAAAGPHTFTARPSGASTRLDANDYFTVTVTETAPNHFESGTVPVGYLATPGWTLNQGNGPREWRESIAFAKAFNAPPEVTVAISMLDAGVAANTRVSVRAENITATGFDLVAYTWDNTIVYSVTASWLAFGDAQ
ncbi:H-type lectin domain-containing protein [Streptomyces sp. NBC_00481]|uniref:H-type lectin domain-containing protein n=1 Tax=unclassified Streptomyces TaxID=2593676 RepID=UPI002DDC1551|nr:MULTISPECIES: H-type lectin domain-containing protein [unclassified Streptomyces]WRY96860.1 H-type lectin domain-containing protein [Streptomyces sp. NBC_00481]